MSKSIWEELFGSSLSMWQTADISVKSNNDHVTLSGVDPDRFYKLEIDIPGIEPKDLNITIKHDTLCIFGKTVATKRSIERTIPFHSISLDGNTLEATTKNGILTIKAKIKPISTTVDKTVVVKAL